MQNVKQHPQSFVRTKKKNKNCIGRTSDLFYANCKGNYWEFEQI